MNTVRRWLKNPLVPILVTAIMLGTFFVQRSDRSPDVRSDGAVQLSPTQPATVLQASERVASETREDWAAVADAVVIAHVKTQRRLEPPHSENKEDSGDDLLGREISLEVGDVLWQAPGALRTPSGVVSMSAPGWLSDGETDREIVLGQSSRLEPDHSYVLALVWVRAECDEGDPTEPAQWGVIGSGGALPADDSIIGRGEYLGAVTKNLAAEEVPPGSVLSRTLGKSPQDVAALVADAPKAERVDFQPNASDCADSPS